MSKITNSKHQITNKSQITNHKFKTGSTRSEGAHAAQAPALRVRRVSGCFFLFGILNFGHAQRRRLRRVLLFVCFLGFVIWNFNKSMNF
ncbi:MAG: hypothetical protein JRD01_06825 [Deltaproteobacteria bacterium]|nr:hypothetical protein [Deltaproteobacteria bacterium]